MAAPSVAAPYTVPPSPAGTPTVIAGVPAKVHPTPRNMVDIGVTPEGKPVAANYPTFDKNVPRTTETVVKAKPGSITQQGGRTAFVTQVVGVTDGDTVVVKDPNNPAPNNPRKDGLTVCRMARIEAPETAKPALYGKKASDGQPYANESKETLKSLIGKGEVTVTVTQLYDNRGKRSVCELEVNGNNLNQAMLEKGMAWLYRTYGKNRKVPSYEDRIAENTAKVNRTGIFSDRNAQYPGDYKRSLESEY